MANMRVHELAKELNITNKEITDILSTEEKSYKPMSGLNDAEVARIKARFDKSKEQKMTTKPQDNKLKEVPKETVKENTKETVKEASKDAANKKEAKRNDDKKSHISQVFFPQNS